jgi:hypothetical protein
VATSYKQALKVVCVSFAPEPTHVEDKLDVGETERAACLLLISQILKSLATEFEGGIVDVQAPQACEENGNNDRSLHGQHRRADRMHNAARAYLEAERPPGARRQLEVGGSTDQSLPPLHPLGLAQSARSL